MKRVILSFSLGLVLVVNLCSCTTPTYNDCYSNGTQSPVAVYVVEKSREVGTFYQLSEPDEFSSGRSSCANFDGFGGGTSILFSDPMLEDKSQFNQCSIQLSDALVDGNLVSSSHGSEAIGTYYIASNVLHPGVGIVANDVTIAGCTGTWVVAVDTHGLALAHPELSPMDDLWPDEILFDQLEEGGEPPLVITRTFFVKAGTVCPALGIEADPSTYIDQRCTDVFNGYYEPAP